jgi:hypothetical protein
MCCIILEEPRIILVFCIIRVIWMFMCLSHHLLCKLNQVVIMIKNALKYLIHKLWISYCYCRMLLNNTIFLKFCIEYFCLSRFLLLFTWWLVQQFLNFSWIYLLLIYKLKKAIVSQILKISHEVTRFVPMDDYLLAFFLTFTCITSKASRIRTGPVLLTQLKSSTLGLVRFHRSGPGRSTFQLESFSPYKIWFSPWKLVRLGLAR